MARLSPSILSADFSRLGETAAMLEEGGADLLHMDVMDGCFVPNISFGACVIKSLADRTGLPFDVHLMVDSPDPLIPDFITARTEYVVVHAEACRHLDRTLTFIRSLGVKSGVALNPATPIEGLRFVGDKLDQVLVMSVNPGFGGQKFIPSALEKIRALRRWKEEEDLSFDINVDGGISLANLEEVLSAGAGMVVMGSAIVNAEEPSDVLRRCKEVCDAHP